MLPPAILELFLENFKMDEDLTKNFKWDDVPEWQEDIEGYELAVDIRECVNLAVESTLTSKGHFDGEEIIIPLPNDLHPLFLKCRDDKYSDISKHMIMDIIQLSFYAIVMQSYSKELTNKINTEIIPATLEHKYSYAIKNLGIYDNVNCSIVGEEKEESPCLFQVEIEVERQKIILQESV